MLVLKISLMLIASAYAAVFALALGVVICLVFEGLTKRKTK